MNLNSLHVIITLRAVHFVLIFDSLGGEISSCVKEGGGCLYSE